MTASFYRNVPNYRSLCACSEQHRGIVVEYHSLKTIVPTDQEFFEFCQCFSKNHGFLLPYVDTAIITSSMWQCITVSKCGINILVVMDHYQYPRYLAKR